MFVLLLELHSYDETHYVFLLFSLQILILILNLITKFNSKFYSYRYEIVCEDDKSVSQLIFEKWWKPIHKNDSSAISLWYTIKVHELPPETKNVICENFTPLLRFISSHGYVATIFYSKNENSIHIYGCFLHIKKPTTLRIDDMSDKFYGKNARRKLRLLPLGRCCDLNRFVALVSIKVCGLWNRPPKWYMQRVQCLVQFYDAFQENNQKELDYYKLLEYKLSELQLPTDPAVEMGAASIWKLMATRDDQLKVLLVRAETVWRKYVHCYLFPLEGDFQRLLVYNSQIDPSLSKEIKRVCFRKVNNSIKKMVTARHELKFPHLPAPVYIYKVPFEHATALIAERAAMMVMGAVYITYADADLLMLERFQASIEWLKQNTINPQTFYIDEKCRLIPGEDTVAYIIKKVKNTRCNIKMKSIGIKIPRVSQSKAWDRLCAERNEIKRECRYRIFWKDYHPLFSAPYFEHNIGHQWDIMKSVSEFWAEYKNVILNTRRSKTLITNYEDEKLDIGEALDLTLFPPCIAHTILRHFRENTHLINKERLIVFPFLCYAGFPLKATQDLWYRMCSQDKNYTMEHNFENQSLGRYPESIYKWYKNINLGQEGKFFGCGRVKKDGLCPYSGDIEDCRLQCKQFMGTKNPKKVMKVKYWSPGVAWKVTRSLSITKPKST